MVFLALLLSPLLALLGAVLRAAVLFWPTMLVMGAANSYPALEWIPALGWNTTFILLMAIALVLPLSAGYSKD